MKLYFYFIFIVFYSCQSQDSKVFVLKNSFPYNKNWKKEFYQNGKIKLLKEYKIGYSKDSVLNQYICYDSIDGVIDYSKSLFVECSNKDELIYLSYNDSLALHFTGHFNSYYELIVVKVLVDDVIFKEFETLDSNFNFNYLPLEKRSYNFEFKILALKKMMIDGEPSMAGPEISIVKKITIEN